MVVVIYFNSEYSVVINSNIIIINTATIEIYSKFVKD